MHISADANGVFWPRYSIDAAIAYEAAAHVQSQKRRWNSRKKSYLAARRELNSTMPDLVCRLFFPDLYKLRRGLAHMEEMKEQITQGERPYDGFKDQMLGLKKEMAEWLAQIEAPPGLFEEGVFVFSVLKSLDPHAFEAARLFGSRPRTVWGIVSGGSEGRVVETFGYHAGAAYAAGPRLEVKDGKFTGRYEQPYELLVQNPEEFRRSDMEMQVLRGKVQKSPADVMVLVDDSEEGVEKKKFLLDANRQRGKRGKNPLFRKVYLVEVGASEDVKMDPATDVVADRLGDLLLLPRDFNQELTYTPVPVDAPFREGEQARSEETV